MEAIRAMALGATACSAVGIAQMSHSAAFGNPPCSECAGDLTGDGGVGVGDLLELLSCWGEIAPGSGGGCECADLAGGGSVGVDDLLALLAAWGECPPAPTTCCEAQPPGGTCNDTDCYDFICGYDSFCCNWWDADCAVFAATFCDVCGGTPPPPSTCCSAHADPGCEDRACQDFVCEFHPSCCTSHWGSNCVQFAIAYCTECGGEPTGCGVPGAGDCCTGGSTPFCDDGPCCECVCAQDPFCCNTVWDSLCGGAANGVCAGSCPCTQISDCCAVHDGSGCDDPACEACVCAIQSSCCGSPPSWGSDCAAMAAFACADECPCQPLCVPGAGSCCVGGTSPGCEDRECCTCVCAQDAFCCAVFWDGICAGRANGVCAESCPCGNPACGPGSGDCLDPAGNGTPGCDDAMCCEAVCADDPFCCTTTWDRLCAHQAMVSPACADGDPVCAEVAGVPDTDCCEPHAGIGCEDFRCCEAVCDADSFCCDVMWDERCAAAAQMNPPCDCVAPRPCGGIGR